MQTAETQVIVKSLYFLKQCVRIIRENAERGNQAKKTVVPERDNPLARTLAPVMTGSNQMILVGTISQEEERAEETYRTLSFLQDINGVDVRSAQPAAAERQRISKRARPRAALQPLVQSQACLHFHLLHMTASTCKGHVGACRSYNSSIRGIRGALHQMVGVPMAVP